MRILIIEDEIARSDRIRDGLSQEGYRVEVTPSHDEGRTLAAQASFDAIIVEVKPQSRVGVQTCQELRRRGISTPVMLVAPTSTTSDRVDGLNAGADDFLTVPFDFEEMLARLRTLMRRGTSQGSAILECEDLEMNLATHRVSRSRETIVLTPKEFALLEYFLRNQGRVLSRSEIASHVWGGPMTGTSNTIDVYISMLRRKIDKGFEPRLIHTIIGYGYLFGVEDPSRPMADGRARAGAAVGGS
jgi:DNA-binding response OmpR family regulator